jgi:hypothetical protein
VVTHRALQQSNKTLRGLAGAEVNSLRTLAHTVWLDVEADLLAVDERAQARSLDSGDVDENVLRAAIRRNEAEAFGCVEELYGTGLGHWENSFTRSVVWTCRPPGVGGTSVVLLGGHAFAHD